MKQESTTMKTKLLYFYSGSFKYMKKVVDKLFYI